MSETLFISFIVISIYIGLVQNLIGLALPREAVRRAEKLVSWETGCLLRVSFYLLAARSFVI